jgi:hypothetical protein
MRVSIKGFIFHKGAESFEDCFDRYAVNTENGKFAIADGVTKSFFPGIWAELLVNSTVNKRGPFSIGDNQDIQKEWKERVAEIVDKPNQKWFVLNAFTLGKPAAATFAGLHFFVNGGRFKWEAVAVGDSFLFYVPDGLANNSTDSLAGVTHLSTVENLEFDNYPDCLYSNRSEISNIKYESGFLKNGTFYLMTDALAEWFISQRQKAEQIIAGWHKQDDFEQSIISLRKKELRDDDVSILIIRVKEDAYNGIQYQNELYNQGSKPVTAKNQ